MTLVDSHCHLNYPGLIEQQDVILNRAREIGIEAFLNISTKYEEWDDIQALAETEKDVWASVGVHPHEADTHDEVDHILLSQRAQHPKIIAIGESGLDFYYDHSDRQQQEKLFREHIMTARMMQLPLIIHLRDAENDMMRIIEEEMGKGAFPAVIHCFTASENFAQFALSHGFYISLSGIATFKNAQNLRDVIKTLPIDRLLVETDAPFLAPVPHRGKTGEPAFVADTAAYLANFLGYGREEFARITTANFYTLFGKAKA